MRPGDFGFFSDDRAAMTLMPMFPLGSVLLPGGILPLHVFEPRYRELLREALDEEDNLLIYYAGHGKLDESQELGYWLPIDAEQGNNINWISNKAITDILNVIEAKHILVVADSCYAGTLTQTPIARVQADVDVRGAHDDA